MAHSRRFNLSLGIYSLCKCGSKSANHPWLGLLAPICFGLYGGSSYLLLLLLIKLPIIYCYLLLLPYVWEHHHRHSQLWLRVFHVAPRVPLGARVPSRGQVAKQMVMTLGMSPEVGQRLLGGQQQGGPFMGALVKLRTRLRDTGLGSKVDCDRDIIMGYSQEYGYFMDFWKDDSVGDGTIFLNFPKPILTHLCVLHGENCQLVEGLGGSKILRIEYV